MKYLFGSLLGIFVFVSMAVAGADGAALYAKSCKGCHGADGAKLASGMTKSVKDMSEEKIRTALVGYKAGTYGGAKKTVMERAMKPFSDEEVEALVVYSASF